MRDAWGKLSLCEDKGDAADQDAVTKLRDMRPDELPDGFSRGLAYQTLTCANCA